MSIYVYGFHLSSASRSEGLFFGRKQNNPSNVQVPILDYIQKRTESRGKCTKKIPRKRDSATRGEISTFCESKAMFSRDRTATVPDRTGPDRVLKRLKPIQVLTRDRSRTGLKRIQTDSQPGPAK